MQNTRTSKLVLLGAGLAFASAAMAQYRIGENGATADAGPVRMARISYVHGNVDWRPESGMEWSGASNNLPMRQGAQVWVPDGTRAEIQFDDGSRMRLGGGAVATLSTLYSDDKGEFTEIKLNNGLATFHLKSNLSLYQIDTPTGSIKAYGPAVFRVGDTSGLEVAVRQGHAKVQGERGEVSLQPRQYLDYPVHADQYAVSPLPHEDDWDRFNDNRDQEVYRQSPYLPANMNLVEGDIDSYGTWRNDPQYGNVWTPANEDPDWRPYRHGHWVWVSPFGYTWVGDEPWGWAPYHYGTWVHRPWGWGWRPGPAAQYWSPAVVHFTYGDGDVAWAPLDPSEVRYPAALSIGFSSGNWAVSFSIGSAGNYYPTNGGYCEAAPWQNRYVNRTTNIYNVTQITNIYNGSGYRSAWAQNNRFVPRNALNGGATFAPSNGFANGGGYRALPAGRAAMFRTGRSFVGAPRGGNPFSGPLGVRPTAASFTPARGFSGRAPNPQVLQRQVYRSAVPAAIAHQSLGMGGTMVPRTTPARIASPGSFARPGSLGRVAQPHTGITPNQLIQRHSGQAPTPAAAAPRMNFVRPGRPLVVRPQPPTIRTPARHFNPASRPVAPARTFNRPTPSPRPTRTFSRPAPRPQPTRTFSRPAPRPQPTRTYNRPAPRPQPMRTYSRPAPRPQPTRTYTRPAPRPQPTRTYNPPTPRPQSQPRRIFNQPPPSQPRRTFNPTPRPEPRTFARPPQPQARPAAQPAARPPARAPGAGSNTRANPPKNDKDKKRGGG